MFPDCHEVEDPGCSYDGRDAFARDTLSEHRPTPSVSNTADHTDGSASAADPRRTYVVSSGET